MLTELDYSNALEYSIIRRYTNIVYYYYHLYDAKMSIVVARPPPIVRMVLVH